MKQPAIEWLYDQIENEGKCIYEVIEQAKEMGKEQMINFAENYETKVYKGMFKSAEQYYNETFKSE
jgi:hypothetical protein